MGNQLYTRGLSTRRQSHRGVGGTNHVPALLLVLLLVLSVGACKSQEVISDTITVDGIATMRGNVPFNELILETDERNYYALQLTADQQASITTPSRLRVTGHVYEGDWNGRPYTFLRVTKLVRTD